MNFNDFKTLKIGNWPIKKLIRTSDGAVIFDKSIGPTPLPQYTTFYWSASHQAISEFKIRSSGTFTIDWGDGSGSLTITPTSSWTTIRKTLSTSQSPYCNILFHVPVDYLIATSGTGIGLRKVIDYGFFDWSLVGRVYVGLTEYDWSVYTYLQEIDLSNRTTFCDIYNTTAFNSCTSLTKIKIPSALATEFYSSNWASYSSLFDII